jgi:hypothetical protein
VWPDIQMSCIHSCSQLLGLTTGSGFTGTEGGGKGGGSFEVLIPNCPSIHFLHGPAGAVSAPPARESDTTKPKKRHVRGSEA